MCHARDFRMFEDRTQEKVDNAQLMRDRRASVIDSLLSDPNPNKESEKTKSEGTPVKEIAPAK